MDTSIIITVISSLGVGGLIGAFLKSMLDRKKEILLKLNQINEEKYRTLLMYMSFIIDPLNRFHFVLNDDNIKKLTNNELIKDYSKSKVNEYYYHSLLYASDDVIKSLKEFIQNPNRELFIKVAKAMRINLWNQKTKLTPEEMYIE